MILTRCGSPNMQPVPKHGPLFFERTLFRLASAGKPDASEATMNLMTWAQGFGNEPRGLNGNHSAWFTGVIPFFPPAYRAPSAFSWGCLTGVNGESEKKP